MTLKQYVKEMDKANKALGIIHPELCTLKIKDGDTVLHNYDEFVKHLKHKYANWVEVLMSEKVVNSYVSKADIICVTTLYGEKEYYFDIIT